MVTFSSCLGYAFAVFLIFFALSSSAKTFDDSILFKLEWSSDVPDEVLTKANKEHENKEDSLIMRSADDEEYVCSLPKLRNDDYNKQQAIERYTGLGPFELILPLHTAKSCTYRIEAYWNYELCHGRFIRQYHEEKEPNKRIKLQEYYLGQYMPEAVKDEDQPKFDPSNPPKRKLEDQFLPYFPVRYVQGTVCDINRQPRVTNVFYLCHEDGRNQIYSIDEVSSCEYELVILTSNLCRHPAFRPDVVPQNKIECYPIPDYAQDTDEEQVIDRSMSASQREQMAKPRALQLWEQEQYWDDRQYARSVIFGPNGEVFGTASRSNRKAANTNPITGEPMDDDDDETKIYEVYAQPSETKTGGSATGVVPPPATPPPADSELHNSFLSGDYCLYGGSGWWKHEYCHGKQVIQFHEDEHTGSRANIMLGMWNLDMHLKWLKDHPHKAPIRKGNKVQQVSLFYANGDICDLTGKSRKVEVRLKCREASTGGSSNAVTLYLIEPKSCEYVLGVESPMLCDIMDTVDDEGLFVNSDG